MRYRKSYFDQPSWDDVDRFNDIKMDRKVHINNDDCVLIVYVQSFSSRLNECGIACNIKENCNVLRFSDGVCQLGTKKVFYKAQINSIDNRRIIIFDRFFINFIF